MPQCIKYFVHIPNREVLISFYIVDIYIYIPYIQQMKKNYFSNTEVCICDKKIVIQKHNQENHIKIEVIFMNRKIDIKFIITKFVKLQIN